LWTPEFDDWVLWQPGGFEEARCLMDALVAQDPVRLKYYHDDLDNWGRIDILIGYADGLVRRRQYGQGNPGRWDETWSCALKPPAYFTACIENEDIECVYLVNDWFVGECGLETEPTCP
jgi:hypothetical protein